jgi:uncharacterized protein (UPF0332 family)
MNEATWNECVINNTSLKITPDKAKAKSLVETAMQRIKFTEKKTPDSEELKFVYEDYYSSMIEIIHAILSIKGYKVMNHLCLGYYLRDILKKEKLYKEFDNARIKRNNIVYYGKNTSEIILKEDIENIKKLIKELEKTYEAQ